MPSIPRRPAWRFSSAHSTWLIWWLLSWGLSAGHAWPAPMVALIILRSVLLATLEAPEPRYTLECFPLVIALAACYFTTWLVPGGGLILKTSDARGVL